MTPRALLFVLTFAAAVPALQAEDAAVSAGTEPVTTDALQKPAAPAIKAEVKVGTGVENKEPVGVSDRFSTRAGFLMAWTRVTGAPRPMDIFHVWKRNGDEVKRVQLRVESASYRTYSRCDVSGQAGNWELEVQDGKGHVLGTTNFDVMPKT